MRKQIKKIEQSVKYSSICLLSLPPDIWENIWLIWSPAALLEVCWEGPEEGVLGSRMVPPGRLIGLTCFSLGPESLPFVLTRGSEIATKNYILKFRCLQSKCKLNTFSAAEWGSNLGEKPERSSEMPALPPAVWPESAASRLYLAEQPHSPQTECASHQDKGGEERKTEICAIIVRTLIRKWCQYAADLTFSLGTNLSPSP